MNRTTSFIAGMLLSISAVGCGNGGEQEPAALRAYDHLLEVVRSGDTSGLYELARPEFRGMMEDLARRLTMASDKLESLGTRVDSERIAEGLMLERFRFPVDGKEMFLELVKMDNLRMSTDVEAGLGIAECTVRGDSALVTTRSGETFAFVREGNGPWYSMLPDRGFEKWSAKEPFLHNLRLFEVALMEGGTEGKK